jgi:hypothetical protein
LEFEVVEMLYVSLLLSLFVSIGKEVVIILVVSGRVGGLSRDYGIQESSLMYKAKHCWSRYLKKMEREFWDSLKRYWSRPWLLCLGLL